MTFYRMLTIFKEKGISTMAFFLLFINSLGLSAAPNLQDCREEFYEYQIGHIIQITRVLEANVESTQVLLPLPPNGTVWIHRPLESLQQINHRHIRVNFKMTPVDSQERAFVTLPSPSQERLVQIDRLNANVYFFELRPIQDLKDEELRRLSPEMIHRIWWRLTNKQISWLTVEQLNWRMSRKFPFAPPHKTWLIQEQVLGINKGNIKNTLDEFDIYRWWKWFSEEQISWLTEDQLKDLVLNIKESTTIEQPKGITILGKIRLKRQMDEFSEEQISELTEDELRDLVLNLRQNI